MCTVYVLRSVLPVNSSKSVRPVDALKPTRSVNFNKIVFTVNSNEPEHSILLLLSGDISLNRDPCWMQFNKD